MSDIFGENKEDAIMKWLKSIENKMEQAVIKHTSSIMKQEDYKKLYLQESARATRLEAKLVDINLREDKSVRIPDGYHHYDDYEILKANLESANKTNRELTELLYAPDESRRPEISVGEILQRHNVIPLAELVDELNDNFDAVLSRCKQLESMLGHLVMTYESERSLSGIDLNRARLLL